MLLSVRDGALTPCPEADWDEATSTKTKTAARSIPQINNTLLVAINPGFEILWCSSGGWGYVLTFLSTTRSVVIKVAENL
jgi:hypothetical protein